MWPRPCSRHGLSFRVGANNQHRAGVDRALVQARANGTGRASTQYLHDGLWHHVAIRSSTGGLTGGGKLDAWIDGRVPSSPDRWFAREGAMGWPWAVSDLAPGGYFAQWADGVWPSLLMLPSAFDGGLDEVAL